MLALGIDDQIMRSEVNPGRQKRYPGDECKVLQTLERWKVFTTDRVVKDLHTIGTMDIATDAIANSLLNAEKLGVEQLTTFVRERLLVFSEGELKKKFRDPMPKVCAPTFASCIK